ncbi:MAG: ribonuclease HI family protein [Patescibacteria group bacterium]
MTKQLVIYTDGGARGNPGPAGAGVVVQNGEGQVLATARQALGVTTNNEAEYQAVLLGLNTAKKFVGKDQLSNYDVEVRLDSELVARQLAGQYQIKEERLGPWFIKIWNERVKYFPHLKFRHIPREDNGAADALANEAMDESNGGNSVLL